MATAAKKKPAILGTQEVAVAVMQDVAPPERRTSIETFVASLPAEVVPSFLARAVPVKKAFDRGVKLAEQRVVTEKIIEGDWIDPDTGVIYVWRGATGDPEVGDPVGLRAALEMLDVSKADLDRAIYQVWKVNFIELANLTHRGKKVADTINDFRGRKNDGPPHLNEKE